MRRVFYHLSRFFFVRKCVGCGEILDAEQHTDAFCPKCRVLWEGAKTANCPKCFGAVVECGCMPTTLKKSGALCLRKLTFYRAELFHTPQNRLLYHLKHQPNRRIEGFVAKELSKLVFKECQTLELECPAQEAVIVYLPRTGKAKRREGFDQSERLAKALSVESGIPFVSAICRTGRSKEQKSLQRNERFQNVKGKFSLKNPEDVKGKCVFLLDDIVTTGAGMSECVKLLRHSGAKFVLCLCIAQD